MLLNVEHYSHDLSFLHAIVFIDKIKKRYGNLGTVLCHTIDRGNSSSIGISLAGHRDRNKMACFIAGINPKGIASSGGLEIGDEILEVLEQL
jgi:inactivation no afterpotential D protein